MIIRDLLKKMDCNSELDIEDSEGNIIYEGLADMQSLTLIQADEILSLKIDSMELGSGDKFTPVLIIHVNKFL